MKGKKTIYQIAEEAQVSISTVSRVLNGSPLVSPRTRAIVQDVIDRNHFSPSALARGLSTSKTHSIGVILPDITNPYFSALFLEIERCAAEQGYSVVLYNTMYGSYSRDFKKSLGESAYFEIALEERLEGVIITGGQIDMDEISADYLKALNRLRREMPVVIIGQEFEGSSCDFVVRDLERGVFLALRHLGDLGHRRIGFLGGEPGVRVTSDRFKAYKRILADMGLACRPTYVHFSDYYVPSGYAAMREQLRGPLPSAVLAINDMVALGAVRALGDAGLSIPEDMALVSCDQFFFSEYTVPRITTLDQQNSRLGRLAMAKLMGLIRGAPEETAAPPEPRLVLGESCGVKLGTRSFE
ncbi:MAG: LacI family transcriptional regulator [Treponema sp.]|jgi:LacI family transcriptional regulator|nr:LacI family transcriptional regulator [Treponema sp.]